MPVLLTGSLDGGPGGDQTVVWALDGRIAAVTPTWAEADRPHLLGVMLPAPMVHDGANRLEIYLLGADDRLAPVGLG